MSRRALQAVNLVVALLTLVLAGVTFGVGPRTVGGVVDDVLDSSASIEACDIVTDTLLPGAGAAAVEDADATARAVLVELEVRDWGETRASAEASFALALGQTQHIGGAVGDHVAPVLQKAPQHHDRGDQRDRQNQRFRRRTHEDLGEQPWIAWDEGVGPPAVGRWMARTAVTL